MVLSMIFLFLAFIFLHAFWLGQPFESLLSILVSVYLLLSSMAFPFVFKEVMPSDQEVERLGLSILKGLYVVYYFAAPVIYLYFLFFGRKRRIHQEKLEKNNHNKMLIFSHIGFIIGSFMFLFVFIFSHSAWIGNSFQSLLSIIVTIYLGLCTWAFSYILNDLNHVVERVLEKPFGHVLLLFIYFGMYIISPFIFIQIKFFIDHSK